MSERAYNEPKLGLNRIYTRSGDRGETSLANGRRVPKDSARIKAYGTVDELSAAIGLARVSVAELALTCPALDGLGTMLLRVQHELFNLGSILATDPGAVHPKQPRIGEADITQLEREIDEANEDLAPLRSFVLPGGCRINAELHLCRTICRRAERVVIALSRTEEVPAEIIRYLNRLSDVLFVWGRWASLRLGADEVLWEPNRASSAQREMK